MLAMPGLQNLDDMPCFEKDRRLARAHERGGIEAEQLERKAIADEAAATRERHRMAFNKLIEQARHEYAQAHAAPQTISAEDAYELDVQAETDVASPVLATDTPESEPTTIPGRVVDEPGSERKRGSKEGSPHVPQLDIPSPEEEVDTSHCGTRVARSRCSDEHAVPAVADSTDSGQQQHLPDCAGPAARDTPGTPENQLQPNILDDVRAQACPGKGLPVRPGKTALWNTENYRELWKLALQAGEEQEESVQAKLAAADQCDRAEDTIPAFTDADLGGCASV